MPPAVAAICTLEIASVSKRMRSVPRFIRPVTAATLAVTWFDAIDSELGRRSFKTVVHNVSPSFRAESASNLSV